MFVVIRQPLRNRSDNTLAASLSFQLVLTTLGGMALQLQRLHEEATIEIDQDDDSNATVSDINNEESGDQTSFVILMGMFFMVIFGLALVTFVNTIPCLKRCLNRMKLCCRRRLCCCFPCCRQEYATDIKNSSQEIDIEMNSKSQKGSGGNETKNDSERTLVTTQTRVNSSVSDNSRIGIEISVLSIGGANSKHVTNPLNTETKIIKDSEERRIERVSEVMKARENRISQMEQVPNEINQNEHTKKKTSSKNKKPPNSLSSLARKSSLKTMKILKNKKQ